MAVTTIYGFRALDKLAFFAVPILAAILTTVLVIAMRRYGIVTAPDPTPPEPMTLDRFVRTRGIKHGYRCGDA